ncbi:MAG: hypothetical protein JXO22_03940, partial [Phycisphaerae bacterium]|nr:hypothetical protein [Phycisphaerae bacterium]
MRREHKRQCRLYVIADGATATLHAVDHDAGVDTLRDTLHLPLRADTRPSMDATASLRHFVQTNRLARYAARVFLLGAGTVVHRLRMPPMKARQRARAIRTRLTTYAAGRELLIAERLLPATDEAATQVLASGADAALVRALCSALRKAGVCVRDVTTLSTGVGAPIENGRVVQVLLGERTSAIQIFEDGHLMHCRDILVGRADLVAAYQRPILADDGPVTLSADEADELCRTVGVPGSEQGPVYKSIRSAQLWPLVTPVIQKLRSEVAQTIQLNEGQPPDALSVLGTPHVPGLADVVATELGIDLVTTDVQIESSYLASLGCAEYSGPFIDLTPPEDRLVRRLSIPALVAGLCAIFIILSNAHTPRKVHAQVAGMQSAAESLHMQQEAMQATLNDARDCETELLARLTANIHLMRALPPCVSALELSRALFASVPPNVTVTQVSINAQNTPPFIDVMATCDGAHVAGVVAANWARALSESSSFAEAEVS